MASPSTPLVMIVDDFEDALEMYRDYLVFSGLRVTTAANGEDAIAVAIRDQPDVIFMDIRMPGMTGTEAMVALRQEPRFNKVPIVALTAHALHAEHAAALRAGFDEVISKPCLPDELVAAIKRLIAQRPRASSPPSASA